MLKAAEFFNVPREMLRKLVNKHLKISRDLDRRYTKSCIRLYLFMISRHIEHRNEICMLKNVTISEISAQIGMSPDTVRNCLSLLETGRIISMSHAYDFHRYNILLHGCKEMYLKKKDYPGALGYVRFSAELVSELLEIKNVNALRYAISQLIDIEHAKRDANSPDVEKRYQSVGAILSDYYRFPSHSLKILKEIRSIFKIRFDKKSFNISLICNAHKHESDRRKELESTFRESKDVMHNLLLLHNNAEKETKISLDCMKKSVNDLVNLALEYGNIEIVKTALQSCAEKFGKHWLSVKKDDVRKKGIYKSVGAAVRTEIRKIKLAGLCI